MYSLFVPATYLTIDMQFPVTLPLPPNHSPSERVETLAHLRMNNGDNVSVHSFNQHFAFTFLQSPRIEGLYTLTQPTPAAPTTVKTRPRYMPNWWPIHTGHALPPMVDVPFAQAKEVNLADLYRRL
jgi:hypothetical protein